MPLWSFVCEDQSMKRSGLVWLYVAALWIGGAVYLPAQEMLVKVLSREQSVERLKSRKLPDSMGFSGGGPVDTRAHNPDGFISVGPPVVQVGGGRLKQEMPDTYRVVGMTYRLLRPDGRVAVARCVSKHDWDGGRETRRSCRYPFAKVNAMQADFHGEKVKLMWMIAPRRSGQRAEKVSETYELVSLSTP
jgi:hypothetical protein